MTTRIIARRGMAALSIGLLCTWGCGAQDEVTTLSPEAGASVDPLIGLDESGLGADDESDRAPGFGSAGFLEEFGEDEEVEDERFSEGERARDPNARPRGVMVKVMWGQLRPNRGASTTVDWSGGLFGEGVDVRLHRVIKFEGRDEIVPTRDRGSVQWVSHTRPHHDGVLVQLVARNDANGGCADRGPMPPERDPNGGDGTRGDPNGGDGMRGDPNGGDGTRGDNRDPNGGENVDPNDRGPDGSDSRDPNDRGPDGSDNRDPNDRGPDGSDNRDPNDRGPDGSDNRDPNTRRAPQPPCAEPGVTFRTAALTQRFGLSELREGRVVAIDDEGNRLLIQALRPPECAAGFLDGRWVNVPGRDGGVFGGRWVAERGRVVGHVLGRYGHNADGAPSFNGQLIARDGRHIGRVAGRWHAFGDAPDPTRGPGDARPTDPTRGGDGNGTTRGGDNGPTRGGEDNGPTRGGDNGPTRGGEDNGPTRGGDNGMDPNRQPPEDPAMRPQRPNAPGGLFGGEWRTRDNREGFVGGHYHQADPGSGFFAGHWAEMCVQPRPDGTTRPDGANRPTERGPGS